MLTGQARGFRHKVESNKGDIMVTAIRCFVTLTLGLAFSSAALGQIYTTIGPPGATSTEAFGLNNRGDIVGVYSSLAPPNDYHGYLLRDGEYSQIDFPGAVCTSARRINNRGDIVGFYKTEGCSFATAFENTRGYLLRHGTFYTIDVPNGRDTLVLGINNRADVVGRYCTAATSAGCKNSNNTQHGFLLKDGIFYTIDFPNATFTSAIAINSSGDIVGRYDTPDGTHAFQLSDGVFRTLDIAPGQPTAAQGINNDGDIAGFAGNNAFILLNDGTLSLFTFPGATTSLAATINSRRQNVGNYLQAGVRHGYLRVPKEGEDSNADHDEDPNTDYGD